MPDLVTKFSMGQPVPEWLIVAEPDQAGAPRGNFRFAVDCDVIDTPDYYVVLPKQGGPYPIDVSGTIGHRVYAAAKNVIVVVQQGGFATLDVQNFTHDLPGLQIMPPQVDAEREAMDRAYLAQAVRQQQPVVTPDPHPTFWSRLKYVFTSR